MLGFFPLSAIAYDMGKVGQYMTISAGGGHTLVLKDDGTLWAWGDNLTGEVGDGTTEDRNVPVKVLDHVVSISAGYGHSLAIREDGTLWAWGTNMNGELGDGTNDGRELPIQIMNHVMAASASFNHSLAIKDDGTLWAWGDNGQGQLGDGTTEDRSIPVNVMNNVIAVSAGYYCSLAITSDGILWAWGDNDDGQLGDGTTEDRITPVKVMDHVIGVSAGEKCSLAIKDDGSLWAWGSNINDGIHRKAQYSPIQVMDHVISASTEGYSLVVKDDGTLWVWGSGMLGDGTIKNNSTCVQVMDHVVVASAGSHHSIAVKDDGSLWAWGNNKDGQLGDGSNETQLSPVKVMDNVKTYVDYFYNVKDPGEEVVLPAEKLDSVTNLSSASNAVTSLITTMSNEQKASATGADLATLYAEAAVAKAASKGVYGSEFIINKAAVSDMEAVAAQTSSAVETALINGGVTTARLVSNTVTLTTDEPGEIIIKIDPDILTTKVDKIRVETPTYALTLKVSDLAPDLTEILTITAQDVGSGYAPGNQNKKTTVKVNLPKGKTSNPVTLSLPTDNGDTTYQAVVKTDGSATSSKYNPATTTMDGKVNTSGSYTVQTNQKDFTDITNKSAEMQRAIRYLASKGIINGTSDTTFSPDGSISRAEIAALLVRALGKLDNSATSSFTDVKSSDWYYTAAGSSQKAGLINGYPDGSFKGTTTIAKDQILAVSARVLKTEMGYKEPSNLTGYLSKYSDGVATWAQPEVALATKENLVVYRVDGTFKGTGNMTRGDAAIIIYRLFQKIW